MEYSHAMAFDVATGRKCYGYTSSVQYFIRIGYWVGRQTVFCIRWDVCCFRLLLKCYIPILIWFCRPHHCWPTRQRQSGLWWSSISCRLSSASEILRLVTLAVGFSSELTILFGTRRSIFKADIQVLSALLCLVSLLWSAKVDSPLTFWRTIITIVWSSSSIHFAWLPYATPATILVRGASTPSCVWAALDWAEQVNFPGMVLTMASSSFPIWVLYALAVGYAMAQAIQYPVTWVVRKLWHLFTTGRIFSRSLVCVRRLIHVCNFSPLRPKR